MGEKCTFSRKMLFALQTLRRSYLLNGILSWNFMYTGKRNICSKPDQQIICFGVEQGKLQNIHPQWKQY